MKLLLRQRGKARRDGQIPEWRPVDRLTVARECHWTRNPSASVTSARSQCCSARDLPWRNLPVKAWRCVDESGERWRMVRAAVSVRMGRARSIKPDGSRVRESSRRLKRVFFQARQVGHQLVHAGHADQVPADHLIGPQRRLLARPQADQHARDDRTVRLNLDAVL